MSIGDFPESLSHAILVGISLVGGLGVLRCGQGQKGAWLPMG